MLGVFVMDSEYYYDVDFGIVKITGGKYKGRFGYYDDDDLDEEEDKEKAVVYFGSIVYNSECVLIDYEHITNDYTFKDLQDRSNEIGSLLWKKNSNKQRVMLVEEKNLIDMEIISMYESYIDSNKLNSIKVFLSHSSVDKPKVISIALDLQKRGISSWLDAFDILPGESIISKINDGLTECNFVLLFLSKNSVKSNWVKKEWESILWDEVNNDKIKIIPIKLDDCEIPKILQTKKYIDFSYDYDTGLFMIIDAIKRYSKKYEEC